MKEGLDAARQTRVVGRLIDVHMSVGVIRVFIGMLLAQRLQPSADTSTSGSGERNIEALQLLNCKEER